jgi:Zn-finger nucleic acid-binding protein
MSERSGIEIDYCPTCRGVWLDRGELDKIIDRAGDHDDKCAGDQAHEHEHEHVTRERNRHGSEHQGRRRKRSMLSELFEFGD